MVLDLPLPDGGVNVLREIRSAGDRFDPDLPVVILSGRTSEADRLRGFEAGADDYLAKPFHYPELLARIAAVLRRRNGHRAGPVQIGELTIDPVTRRVTVGEREVRLANKGSPSSAHSRPNLIASSPSTSFFGMSGDFAPRVAPGRWTPASAPPKLDPDGARYVFNCWGVGYRLLGG